MARKMKAPHPFVDVPDFKTAREMIEYGHIKAGDQKQYVYLETRTKERTKTFNEVWYDTVGLGQNLYMRGLSGKKVAILSDNSYYWIACFYSILTGKYTVIPLDAKLMDDDIIDIMRRSHCNAIYYSDEFSATVEKLKKADGVCLTEYIKISDFYELIEAGHADIKAGNKCYLDEPPLPEDIATIVFTSGTTGKSKGVMLSHKNIMSSAVSSARLIQGHHAIGFLPMNHTFAWASALFLVNVFSGWGYICRSLKDIPQDMKKYHPQNIAGVPLLIETIYKTIWRTAEKSGKAEKLRKGIKLSNFLREKLGIDIRRKLFKEVIDGLGGELEYIVIGGAYLDPVYEKGLSDLGVEVFNGYGTTECSPGITISTYENYKFGSCGKPMGCEIKIKDPDEDGVGEICVKGDNVMVGYFEDPEATASVFDGDWFKTGDFGYIDEDGFLFYVGRKKNLIVLSNGKNVSPEELEDQLTRLDYVKEVIVSEEDNLITAEFYLDEELCPDAKERIKEDVKKYNATLPTYKRILQIKTRDTEFPKTTSLKIKRKYKEDIKA